MSSHSGKSLKKLIKSSRNSNSSRSNHPSQVRSQLPLVNQIISDLMVPMIQSLVSLKFLVPHPRLRSRMSQPPLRVQLSLAKRTMLGLPKKRRKGWIALKDSTLKLEVHVLAVARESIHKIESNLQARRSAHVMRT